LYLFSFAILTEKVVFPAKQRHFGEFDWFLKFLKGDGQSPYFWTEICRPEDLTSMGCAFGRKSRIANNFA